MRSCFKSDLRYYGRLYSVQNRPLENRAGGFTLIRLEFQVFELDAKANTLVSTGSLASRDLVIGASAGNDSGVLRYGEALEVKAVMNPAKWKEAEGRWVVITFGEPQEPDYRHSFATIGYTGIRGLHAEKSAFDIRENWTSPAAAAKRLFRSENTIRRLALKHAQQWRDHILRFKPARTRNDMLVNVALLKHLEKDATSQRKPTT